MPHLYGGQTGWISAGNPWQWVTPAGEITPYPTGVGLTHVPDMPPPGHGATTLYYPNEQSGRLMWLHDNTLGLSRLTVHSGQLALYLLTDPAEERLVADGVLPAEQLPLVIQDRTFVPDDTQLAAQDPTWDRDRWGPGAACGTRTSTSPGRTRTGPRAATRPAAGTTARGPARRRAGRRRPDRGRTRRPTAVRPGRRRTRTTTRSPPPTSRRWPRACRTRRRCRRRTATPRWSTASPTRT